MNSFLWGGAVVAAVLFGSPLVIPLQDGVYSCARVNAPITIAPPNVEVVDGEITDVYSNLKRKRSFTYTDMKKEYDYPWVSTFRVALNGKYFECTRPMFQKSP